MKTVMPTDGVTDGRTLLANSGGMGDWFRASDHKRISLLFLAWTASSVLLALIMGIMVLLKGPGIAPQILFQTQTYQRLVQVTTWLVPVLPMVIGYFVLPLQLGARDLTLPILSRWSLRLYVVGLVLMILSLAWCPVGTGWTLDTQLSLLDPGSFALLMLALISMGLSWFLTGVNFLVTVHHGRREGMGFFDMPLTSWGLYLFSYLLVISGLILAIIALYMIGSRISTKGMFGWDSDPMLWRTYFWFAMRPVAFFALIPGVGIVSDVISGMVRRPSTGYRTLVGSLIALTAIAVGSYGVGLAGQGLSPSGTLIFSFLSLLAAVPVALISLTWLSTMYRGSTTCAAPGAFSIAFILFGGVASLLGLFLASPAVGTFLGATMFASAQLDYLTWGAAMAALMAGLHYWWPRMIGGAYNDTVARMGAVLQIVGLNLALVPRLMMGTRGVPQDMASLVPGHENLVMLSNVGWVIVCLGLVVVAWNLIPTLWSGRKAEANPWGAVTPEWAKASDSAEEGRS
jgi:cytochrome c oxidase subunit 1